mgnify:CR=1 FL=1
MDYSQFLAMKQEIALLVHASVKRRTESTESEDGEKRDSEAGKTALRALRHKEIIEENQKENDQQGDFLFHGKEL